MQLIKIAYKHSLEDEDPRIFLLACQAHIISQFRRIFIYLDVTLTNVDMKLNSMRNNSWNEYYNAIIIPFSYIRELWLVCDTYLTHEPCEIHYKTPFSIATPNSIFYLEDIYQKMELLTLFPIVKGPQFGRALLFDGNKYKCVDDFAEYRVKWNNYKYTFEYKRDFDVYDSFGKLYQANQWHTELPHIDKDERSLLFAYIAKRYGYGEGGIKLFEKDFEDIFMRFNGNVFWIAPKQKVFAIIEDINQT